MSTKPEPHTGFTPPQRIGKHIVGPTDPIPGGKSKGGRRS